MSLWIPRKDQLGRRWYFAVDVPSDLVMPVVGFTLVVLLGNLAASPVRTLLVTFATAVAGSVLIGIGKWNQLRRGVPIAFGSAGMSPGMAWLYRIGWALVIAGTAATLMAAAFLLRR